MGLLVWSSLFQSKRLISPEIVKNIHTRPRPIAFRAENSWPIRMLRWMRGSGRLVGGGGKSTHNSLHRFAHVSYKHCKWRPLLLFHSVCKFVQNMPAIFTYLGKKWVRHIKLVFINVCTTTLCMWVACETTSRGIINTLKIGTVRFYPTWGDRILNRYLINCVVVSAQVEGVSHQK